MVEGLKGRTALVTGAGGFIGSHLVERLVDAGVRVRAMVRYVSDGGAGWLDQSPARETIEVVRGDLADPDSVDAAVAGRDLVFHLGALIAIPYSYEAPESYVRTNVTGTLNVLRAVRRHGVGRMVHVSTSEVYGSAQVTPMTEAHPLVGQSPYSATKIAADKLAESFFLSFETPVVTIRPYNTFGPRQSARAIIPTVTTQTLFSDRVRIGDPEPTRDFVFVRDTVEGMALAGAAPGVEGRTIHLGTGRETRIGDLPGLIASLAGRGPPVEHQPQRRRPAGSEVTRLVADAAQAEALLGWRPQVTLEAGLAEVVAFVRARPDLYRPEEYAV